jgi:hypothetical protein
LSVLKGNNEVQWRFNFCYLPTLAPNCIVLFYNALKFHNSILIIS